ncbi:TPA: ParB N-terminal domain-containing protein [Pasteurella multocida]|nr:ParB N-terminal domain-containing protein [Pasteurella multocida]
MQKEKKLQIEHININELKPCANNSRTHSNEQIDQICASIKEFGFTNPILIDENNEIIAGHGRLIAADRLNLKDVPTIRLIGLTEAQKKAYVIADNKIALNAGWDEELLKIELTDLNELDFNLELTGFSNDEINKLFNQNNDLNISEFDQLIDEQKNILMIEFDSEIQLQKAYEEYSSKGFKCKILE